MSQVKPTITGTYAHHDESVCARGMSNKFFLVTALHSLSQMHMMILCWLSCPRLLGTHHLLNQPLVGHRITATAGARTKSSCVLVQRLESFSAPSQPLLQTAGTTMWKVYLFILPCVKIINLPFISSGDGLHWSYFVLQDPPGLISLFNSTEDFQNQLELFFTEHVQYNEKFGEAVPNPYFWQGNEVDHFSVFLFNYGPKCALSQYWSRALTNMHFSNTPHGVPGNEDYGAMSSWLLFASLGVFPRAGSTDFMLGSPRVRDASLQLKHLDGSTSVLEILTVNNSAENVYVSSLLVNGVEHKSTVIDRSVLMNPNGCRLEFTMSATPDSGLC